MYLDKRSSKLLLEMVKNPHGTFKYLEDKFNLSPRQVKYALGKINEWLAYKGVSQVELNQTEYDVLEDIFEIFEEGLISEDIHYSMSRKERVEAIIIYVLLRRESLSLEHLAQELDVSKNTILNDIRIANIEYLNKTSIVYDRHDGYLIDGNEWDKRKLMVKSIISLASNTRGISFLDKIVIKDEFRQYRIKKMLEHIEEETHQSFVDIRLNTLSYEVEAIIQRVENAYYLSEAYPIEFEDLSDTR